MGKRDNQHSKLEATAYHEAGHAVADYRLGFVTGPLTIEPSENALGKCVGETAWLDGSRDREAIVALYAGFEAQRRFDPSADRGGSSSDDQSAAELLARHQWTEHGLRDEATRLIELNWPHISAVAEALLRFKTMVDDWTIIIDAVDEGEDWKRLYEEYRRRAASEPDAASN